MKQDYKRFIPVIIGLALALSFGKLASAQAKKTASEAESLSAPVTNTVSIETQLKQLVTDLENALAEIEATRQEIILKKGVIKRIEAVNQHSLQSLQNMVSECGRAKSLMKDNESKELSDQQVATIKKLIEECFEAASKEEEEILTWRNNYEKLQKELQFMVKGAELDNIKVRIIESKIQILKDRLLLLELISSQDL